ncbi:hypothetical protein AWU67_04535 [Microterricola viridarii]|uniref:Uncharacterized protein n=1 Tax=Microterricola viridarii TaxID=412690 RepID=A0A0X8E3A9_9MICO|nr:hypothetical protein AWU67_04535 [Microterricola viridarii]
MLIDGAEVPSSWTGHDRVGLEALAIKWGRAKLYDKPKPSILTMTVIDPVGRWAASIAAAAPEIIVHTSSDVGLPEPVQLVHFRGVVESVTIEPVTLQHPTDGTPMAVWRAEITAVDPLAALAGARPAGPYWDTAAGAFGVWGNANMTVRFDHLRAAGMLALAPNVWQPPGDLVMGGHSSGTSLLDLLDAAYSTVAPFARAQYDPNDATAGLDMHGLPAGMVRPGGLAATAGLRLELHLEEWQMGTENINSTVIDAGLVEMPASQTVQAGAAESIDIVRHVYKNLATDAPADGFARSVSASKAVAGRASKTERTLEYSTDLMHGIGGAAPAVALLADLATLVGQMNGRMTPPTVRLSERRLRPAAPTFDAQLGAYWAALFVPATAPRAYYFPGNRYARLGTMPAGYQIIGGEIVFGPNGWHVDADLAPARFTSVPIKVGELVVAWSGPVLPYNRFDPTIRLADFQYITKH